MIAMENLNPKNIIVKMPNWLGDAVMATPILEDLRTHFPQAKLTALCQSNVVPLLTGNPFLNELVGYKKPSGWIHRAEHHDVIRPLQMGEYDLGLLLTNSFSTAWWFWRGRVKERIGFATNLRSCLLTSALVLPKNLERQHLITTYKLLLQPLGIPLSNTTPKLFLSAEDRAFASKFLSNCQISKEHVLIGINPGAAYGSAKCWPPEKFKEVALKLLENPRNHLLFFGDQSGAPLVQEICQNMPARVINLAGKTSLRELMALIGACSVFLTNDSGPMHIASALKIPLVAIFGSTNEVKTGPYHHEKVIHKHVECSPCYRRTCPIDFRCMTRIGSEEVFQELQKIIKDVTAH